MRPGEAHCTRFLSAERYERYAVNFPLSLFDSFDPERRLMKPFTDRPLGHRNHYYILGIKDTLSELAYFEGDDYSRTLLFTTKLAGVMDMLGKQSSHNPTAEPTISEQLVWYVNDMLCEEITVERLAEHFFLSASQFTRLFKERQGLRLCVHNRQAACRRENFYKAVRAQKEPQKFAVSMIIRFSIRHM